MALHVDALDYISDFPLSTMYLMLNTQTFIYNVYDLLVKWLV